MKWYTSLAVVCNVRTYGAKPDAITDSAPAIQTAWEIARILSMIRRHGGVFVGVDVSKDVNEEQP